MVQGVIEKRSDGLFLKKKKKKVKAYIYPKRKLKNERWRDSSYED